MNEYTLLQGDCVESMRRIQDGTVNCCVTSPPYFGLRDYDVDGQIGIEDTPEAYVARLVEVFREVKRVLRDDGTLWLNLGDSYGKNKQLLGIPWRVAFALQADGWYLRQDIIWHKPNPMPESVRDRCTKAHEYIFLLSKSQKYYYDHESVKEAAVKGAAGSHFNRGKTATHQMGRSSSKDRKDSGTRNRRSVWTVSTKPYNGAHFATFPPDLIEPCILAGCPEGGTVIDPFGGSGTTAGVAVALNRRAILCEINHEYAALVPERVRSIVMRYDTQSHANDNKQPELDLKCETA